MTHGTTLLIERDTAAGSCSHSPTFKCRHPRPQVQCSVVAFNLNPPIPLQTPRGRAKHDIFIGYLLRYRVKYKGDGDTPPPKELVPEERLILDELQTEDAQW